MSPLVNYNNCYNNNNNYSTHYMHIYKTGCECVESYYGFRTQTWSRSRARTQVESCLQNQDLRPIKGKITVYKWSRQRVAVVAVPHAPPPRPCPPLRLCH